MDSRTMEEMMRLMGTASTRVSDFPTPRMSSPWIEDSEPEPQKKPPQPPPVTWGDIIGLEDAKTQLAQAIEAPFVHEELYRTFKMTPPKGVLLYGPPGCGKTMLGKAAAHSMAKTHKKDVFDGFFYYNGAEMFSPQVGAEEKWVREAFSKAEDFYKANGFPAILFFDEADSMLPDRNISPPWTRNAVNQFLSLMDGVKQRTAFVILATNNHQILDRAAIRPGRIDQKIYVPLPDKAAIKEIVRRELMDKPSKENLSDVIIGDLYSEGKFIGERQLSEYLNGAHAVDIVKRAVSVAFQRALKETKTKQTLWVTKEDVRIAVESLFSEISTFEKVAASLPKPSMDLNITHSIDTDGKDKEGYV